MKMHRIITILVVICLLSACGAKTVPLDETCYYPAALLPGEEEIIGSSKEGDIVDSCGDGIRSQTEVGDISVIRLYANRYSEFLDSERHPILAFHFTRAYGFNKLNQLIAIIDQFDYEKMENKDIRTLLTAVEDMIIRKYGEPSKQGEIWYHSTYRDDEGMFKYAIENSHYQKIVLWERDDYSVVLNVGDALLEFTNNADEIAATKRYIQLINNKAA